MKIEERYNQHYHDLNENDQYIWNYLKNHKKECVSLSINEMAKCCNVSRTTILRFAKKLGFSGYSELKHMLKHEVDQSGQKKIDAMHTIVGLYNDVIRSVLALNGDEIFDLFNRSKNLYVYSTGTVQDSVASEIKRIFLSAGLLFHEIKGETECTSLLKDLTPDDCVVMVSYSGESEAAVELAKALRVRNIPTVSMTALQENQLSRLSSHSLYVSSADIVSDKLNIDYRSLTGFFILVEMLFMKYVDYCESNFDEEHLWNLKN